jgi:hypothetical protein
MEATVSLCTAQDGPQFHDSSDDVPKELGLPHWRDQFDRRPFSILETDFPSLESLFQNRTQHEPGRAREASRGTGLEEGGRLIIQGPTPATWST